MKTKKIISFLLLSIMVFSLFGMSVKNEVKISMVIGHGKYYLPDGSLIFLLINQKAVISGVEYIVHVYPRDSWWKSTDPGGRYDVQKFPAEKKIILLSQKLEYIMPPNPNVFLGKRKKEDFFLSKKETRHYSTKFGNISLVLNEKVFPPSEHGSASFLSNICINSGEKIIDIGTGAGILAIAAAKAGGKVYATDIQKEAISLTNKNAMLNQVKINTAVGKYFASFIDEHFDVIIANLPQEIIPQEYGEEIGNLKQTISGGAKGNEVLLPFLEELTGKMNKDTRAYILVYTVTNYVESLQKISNLFQTRLIATEIVGTKPFVVEYERFYKRLLDKGEIYIFKNNGEWQALIYVFELRKK